MSRARIHGAILGSPGIRYRQLMRLLNVGNGALSYHLYVLEREMRIRSVTAGPVRRFYPAGMEPPEKMVEITPLQRKVLFTLVNEPGLSESDVAEGLQIPVHRAGRNIRVLRSKGLVRLEQAGRETRCYPTSLASELRDDERGTPQGGPSPELSS